MEQTLKSTTVQTARLFLSEIGMDSSPYASSEEVIALLVGKIKAGRNDPGVRRRLHRLLEELASEEADLGSQLPCPECQSVDPKDLMQEISAAALCRDSSDLNPRRPASLASACALLFSLAASSGCRGGRPSAAEAKACSADVSMDHYMALVEKAAEDAGCDSRAGRAYYFEHLPPSQQKQEMETLCGMTPAEIASYLTARFTCTPPPGRSWAEILLGRPRQFNDVAYKGVSF